MRKPTSSRKKKNAWGTTRLRASPEVLLQKYFSPPSLDILTFCNPAHKTETDTANRWETSNSKPPGRIIRIDQSETGTNKWDHIYCTLLWQVHSFAVLLTSLSKTIKVIMGQNHIAQPSWDVLTFLNPILLCRVTYEAQLGII
jgi:hypothetical protein